MTTTNLENVKQRINEFKSAPADQRQYTGYASWVNWFTDLEWAIARIEALEAQLPSVESAAPAVPAPRVPDAPVPIHGDPLDGLRKAIEGHAALSKLEAMTKLYEIQRMAKDIISSDFGSVTPQVVVRLRGLRILEMGPSDCVIELIKLAEMLAPGMTLSAAPVTAPVPSSDSAAARVKLSKAQRKALETIRDNCVVVWSKNGSWDAYVFEKEINPHPISTLKKAHKTGKVNAIALESLNSIGGLIVIGRAEGTDRRRAVAITDAGRQALAQR